MNSLMKSIAGIAILMSLSACVEVKDKDDNQKKVIAYEARNLTVDEPYYVINGELLRKKDFTNLTEQNLSLKVGDLQEYEIRFDHLTLKEGGVIYTMGQIVKIYAEDFESHGGVISTYPSDHEAFMNVDGRTGGNITLNFTHARGDLRVLMVGERGGKGLKGPPSNDKTVYNIGSDVYCVKATSGSRGGTGSKGGLSGIAEIFIHEFEGFDLSMDRKGGLGGRGGDGGDGPLPGNNLGCDPKYFRGDQGPTGDEGIAGPIQYVCITKGQKSRQCY